VDTIDLELFKSLQSQSAAYGERVQGLWLQKLTLSGALAAFFILRPDEIGAVQPYSPIVIGIIVLVALAIVIDLKVLEYGLHMSVLSQFVARNFADAPRVAEWEATLWGRNKVPESNLSRWRSLFTVLSAALPTLALLIGMTWLFGHERLGAVQAVGPLAIAGYLAVMSISAGAILRYNDRVP
jgi:hypothetical protein